MPSAPVLLAIDTATSVCSVALALHGAVHERLRDVGHGHTRHVLPMLDELLAAHHVALNECAAIAFGAGPGSFTGLRIACGIAQGLAFGIDRPVLPVGNLAALACDAFARSAQAARILVAQDARMNEVYWAVYERAGGKNAEIVPPAVALPAELAEIGARHRVDAIAGDVLTAFPASLQGWHGARIAAASASARSVAALALGLFAGGGATDAAEAAPLYVRDRVAFTIDERRALAAGKVVGVR